MKRRLALALVVLALAGGASCSSDQDPGLTPEGTGGGPSTTSQLLSACSDEPDATIPVGGCLDADGTVIRPGAEP